MRPILALLGLCLVLAGCTNGGPPEQTTVQGPVTTVSNQVVRAPDLRAKATLLGIVRRSGKKVKVGESSELAFSVFQQPPNAYEFSDLPSVLNGEHFKAAGWQTTAIAPRANEGFGVILYDDQVCLAVYQIDRLTESAVQEILRDHQQEIQHTPTDTFIGRYARYWFWEEDNRRLMIVALTTPKDGINLTTAVGDTNIMDALGMSPTAAKSDQPQAERSVIERIQATTPPGK